MNKLLFIIGIIGFVCYIFYKICLKSPSVKGKIQEMMVHKELQRLSDEYTIINNLLLGSNGRHVQIDHVVISPYGVFVIETKGYKGLIIGGERSEFWTQRLYRKKFSFYNPIKQNEGHVKYLRFLLQCTFDIPIIPIVCFSNSAILQLYDKNNIVVNRHLLRKTIEQYQNRVLSEEQTQSIVAKIQNNCQFHNKVNVKLQKEYAKRRKCQEHFDLNNGICPKCGGELVLRKGKYGSFIGCSNYPYCKFTTN